MGFAHRTTRGPNLRRVRRDVIDTGGKVSIRYGNPMIHGTVDRRHTRTETITFVPNLDGTLVGTLVSLTGTVLSDYKINPNQR